MHEFQPVGKLVNLCFAFCTIVEGGCLATLPLMVERIKAQSAIFLLISYSLQVTSLSSHTMPHKTPMAI